jgi:hypothetical protein
MGCVYVCFHRLHFVTAHAATFRLLTLLPSSESLRNYKITKLVDPLDEHCFNPQKTDFEGPRVFSKTETTQQSNVLP